LILAFYWGFFIPSKEFGDASHSLSAFKGQQSAVKMRSLTLLYRWFRQSISQFGRLL